jgi:hypothetical protein
MSSPTNFLPVLARKMHHATSFLGLLIAPRYCFEFFLPCPVRDHIEYRLRRVHLSLCYHSLCPLCVVVSIPTDQPDKYNCS